MDLEVKESRNGGDLIKNPKDLSVISGFENMPYLAMFGGNIEASTKADRLATEQDFSFWGNNLFFSGNSDIQFNSETERTLKNTALTSAGRSLIENAIRKDLEFMKSFANIKVAVTIISTDKVAFGIQITKPDNLQTSEQIYIWDATIKELIAREFEVVKGQSSGQYRFFDFSFDLSFE